MLSIVGHKISMQQGEDCSFSISIKDLKGNNVELLQSDNFVLRLKKRRSPEIVLSKDTKAVNIGTESEPCFIHIFEFNKSDTEALPFGEYVYDVTFEAIGKSSNVVINRSPFILDYSIQGYNSSVEDEEGSVDESIEDCTYLQETTIPATGLVGVLSYTEFNRTYVEEVGKLILF